MQTITGAPYDVLCQHGGGNAPDAPRRVCDSILFILLNNNIETVHEKLQGWKYFGVFVFIFCRNTEYACKPAPQNRPGASHRDVGVGIALLTAFVIFGGIRSIAGVCEKLVPFMAVFYVLGCIIILCMNSDYIIPAVQAILRLAFTPGAAAAKNTLRTFLRNTPTQES